LHDFLWKEWSTKRIRSSINRNNWFHITSYESNKIKKRTFSLEVNKGNPYLQWRPFQKKKIKRPIYMCVCVIKPLPRNHRTYFDLKTIFPSESWSAEKYTLMVKSPWVTLRLRKSENQRWKWCSKEEEIFFTTYF